MSFTHQSKSTLAKLLATEDITIRHDPAARTASFDVRNRVLVLPVWQAISEDLYDLLVVHEVGHALDTPEDEWLAAIDRIATNVSSNGVASDKLKSAVRGFLNVVEDPRIDKRQKRRFPGCRRNYILGYKELIARDFFGTAGKDINTLSFIDRLNMFFKGGALLGVKFSPEEKVLLREVEQAETFAEVEALAEKIYNFAKSKKEEDKQKLRQMEDFVQGGNDGQEFSDDYDADDSDWSDDADDDSDESASADQGDEEEDNESENSVTSEDNNSDSEDDDVIESETERAYEQRKQDIVRADGTEWIYVTTPEANIENIVRDYKTFIKNGFATLGASNEWIEINKQELNKFRADENQTISFMVKEFEARKAADIYSRISIAKTGVLDTNKLHNYKFSEDIFRRLAITPNGKNHGFVMILDWSGSMVNTLTETMKQLFILTMFCKRVQIPFEVYTFLTDYTEKTQFNQKVGDLNFDNRKFRMTNILSSRMNIKELNDAYTLLWIAAKSRFGLQSEPMGSTPMLQAIVATEKLVKEFQSRNKVQVVSTIFLTDGEADPIFDIFGRVKGMHDSHLSRNKKRYVFQDTVTKKSYELPFTYGKFVSTVLLQMLKDRTNCNLIGFYLYGGRRRTNFKQMYAEFFGHVSTNAENYNKIQKQWQDDKFVPVKTSGYDDYYIMNAAALREMENPLNVNNTMTKAAVARAFIKFSEKKSLNRVLLRSFIGHVTGERKAV